MAAHAQQHPGADDAGSSGGPSKPIERRPDAGKPSGGDDGPRLPSADPDAGRVVVGGSTRPVCDAVTQVLLPSCGGGSCHSNSDARIGDWAAGRAQAESFVDVPSVRDPSCGLIIDSSDPSQSLLYRKLVGDFPSPKCGGPMPVSTDLTDVQIACMGSWLQQFERP